MGNLFGLGGLRGFAGARRNVLVFRGRGEEERREEMDGWLCKVR